MKNKKWLLLLIIALPSFMWILLETSTINSSKLNYYGPKKPINNKDTVFYSVGTDFYTFKSNDTSGIQQFHIDSLEYPLFAIMFVKESYNNDSYRLPGLWEYLNYNQEKIKHVPFFLVTEFNNNNSIVQNDLQKLTDNKNVKFLCYPKSKFDSINYTYFLEKPIHIDHSFFVLVDPNRNIRGYYDARYASEVKRLADEYKHLRLKDEKQKLIKENEIKTNN